MIKWKACCIAVVPLLCSRAYGQSSVTLFGLLETGISYTSNVNGLKTWEASSGEINQDRFGLSGTEDLGDGSRAIFMLENGFSIDNGSLGQGGLLFGRQAYVGLSNNFYGTFTMGRQYDSVSQTLAGYGSALMYNGYYTAHMGDIDHIGGERTNNAVRYITPAIGGVTVEVMYGLGGVPGSVVQGSTMSIGAKYTNGNFSVGAATLSVRNTTVDLHAVFGIRTFDGVQLTNGSGSSLPATILNLSSLGVFGVGASYKLGAATISSVYTQTYLNNALLNGSKISERLIRIAEFDVIYKISPFISWGSDFTYTKFGEYRWGEVGTIVHYYLSKRTDIYATTVYQRAMGAAEYANIYATTGPSTSVNQFVGRVGIRHAF
jgi:outer membrane protein OmpU